MSTAQSPRLDAMLTELGASGALVGASIAVGNADAIEVAAWGETRFGTGQQLTTRTVLQIGSISKLYTATLIMQLVEQGRVELDQSLRHYVPEFLPKDLARADEITVRQLLSHTSGLQADFIADGGRGDDCLSRFVDECASIEQGAPGGPYEYCNAGYVLLGRVIEKVTDEVWDDVLAQRILRPAQLELTMTLPEQVLLHENAAGHFPDAEQTWQVPAVWSVPRIAGPAGTICATAADVVRFACCHLTAAADTLLAPTTRELMQTTVVMVEGSEVDERCALGWHRRTAHGHELIGHTGGNMGQGGMLWIEQDQQVAVCLLVNGLSDMSVLESVLDRVW